MKQSAADFEAWMRKEHPTHPLARLPQADGSVKYVSAGTEHKWVGWQGAMAQKAGNSGAASLPAQPDIALLVAMAHVLDHDFSLLSAPQQQTWLKDMRRVYDQITGRGFYRPEDRERYIEHLAAELRAEYVSRPVAPTSFCLESARADLGTSAARNTTSGVHAPGIRPDAGVDLPTSFSLESARADLEA